MERVRIEKRPTDSLADDLLYGAEPIAEFLGLKKEQVFYLVRTGKLPVTRLGERIVGSKTVLRARFSKIG